MKNVDGIWGAEIEEVFAYVADAWPYEPIIQCRCIPTPAIDDGDLSDLDRFVPLADAQ